MDTIPFNDVVKNRHSCRGFLSQEIPADTLMKILENAQLSPSNCNTQPWNVHIVSGLKQQELSEKLIRAAQSENFSPDFTFDIQHFHGRYKERQFAQGKVYYEALGVDREDIAGRKQANILNYRFYNAPSVAFLFMPSTGDNVRIAGDIGMYAQTFLLSLTAQGLAGVPQTVLGFFADVIREHLGISDDFRLLFGISFGYEDRDAAANKIRMDRDPITENVTFHR